MAKAPTLAATLQAARVRRNLSVADLAAQSGASATSIYQWEAGKHRPREAILTELCKVLKLPVRATRDLG